MRIALTLAMTAMMAHSEATERYETSERLQITQSDSEVTGLNTSHASESVIKPGIQVFLKLPFTEQEKGGICASASLLNIVEFMGTRFKLSQKEFFSLFDSGRSGANSVEMTLGLNSLGYTKKTLFHKYINEKSSKEDKEILITKIRTLLESGVPLSIAKPGHAFTMVGYDVERDFFIVWDQGKTGATSNTPEEILAPMGLEIIRGINKIDTESITNRLYRIEYLTPIEHSVTEEDLKVFSDIVIKEEHLKKHKIYTFEDKRKSETERFLRKAFPILTKGLLRNKIRVAIPTNVKSTKKITDGEDTLIILEDFNEGGMESNGTTFKGESYPSKTSINLDLREIGNIIVENKGYYYSL